MPLIFLLTKNTPRSNFKITSIMEKKKKHSVKEFDKFGRYIESPCYGCFLADCSSCERNYESY